MEVETRNSHSGHRTHVVIIRYRNDTPETQINTGYFFYKSRNKETSPKKHELRGAGGKYMSASEIEKERKEGHIAEIRIKATEVDTYGENSEFEFYSKSEENRYTPK